MRVSRRSDILGRRRFLAGSGASLVTLAIAAPARALPGGDELSRLLGTRLPPQVTALLPGEVFEGAGFIRKLMALETEARVLRLPPSKLSRGEGAIPLDPERLYEAALPRLVALIDRSELRNLGFADKAGELLSFLHGTQHVPAEIFAALPPAGSALRPMPFFQDATAPGPLTLPATPAPVPVETPPVVEVARPVVQPLPEPDSQTEPEPEPAPDAPTTLSRSLRFEAIAGEYEALFRSAELREEHRDSADWHLAMMRQSKPRYAEAGKRTGVPWFFIAAIHGLEASFNFRAHFHNGDFPLTRRTRQVPAGRPLVWLPPSDWEASTVDALRLMGFAGASDWSLPRTLWRLEAFNGFGYRRIGRATPYLWSYSNHYERGKFVADGHFNPNARSQQCGAAMMLKLLAQANEIGFA